MIFLVLDPVFGRDQAQDYENEDEDEDDEEDEDDRYANKLAKRIGRWQVARHEIFVVCRPDGLDFRFSFQRFGQNDRDRHGL